MLLSEVTAPELKVPGLRLPQLCISILRKVSLSHCQPVSLRGVCSGVGQNRLNPRLASGFVLFIGAFLLVFLILERVKFL